MPSLADPFAFTDPLSQPNFGVPTLPKPAQVAAPAPPQRTAASTMLAPAAPAPAPAPVQQPQHPATGGNVDQFMQLVRAHESGGNDKASSGVANGRYQFTPATWAGVARQHPELGLQPNDIWDGNKQDLAMRAITQDYENVLSMQGIPASMPNMFMLHFLGTGGGPKFLKQMQADPNANAAALFPTEAQYNPTIFHDKAGQPRTLQQVYALMTKSFGGPAAAPMAPADPAALKAQGEFEKAANVSPQVRNFTEGRAEAEDATASALPPPPPGVTLRARPKTADLPPPPPGVTLKLDLSADKPLTEKAYTDKDGKYHPGAAPPPAEAPKPGKGLQEIEGYDPAPPGATSPVGEPKFADPKAQAEYDKASREADKGVAAGMAQDITGPASLLPNALGGGYAEEANRALAETGTKEARTFGSLIPAAIPVGGLLSGTAKAGTEAAEALGWGGKAAQAGKAAAKSTAAGAATGALSESSNPVAPKKSLSDLVTGGNGSTTMGDRWAGKAKDMAWGGLFGAGVGVAPATLGAAKALGSEAKNVGKFVADVFSGKVKKAAEELRTGFSATTGKELTKEEMAARAATVEKAAEEAVIAKHAQERKAMPPEQVGKELQPVIEADRKAVFEKRKKESGFADAVKSDGGQPLIKTRDATTEIEKVEKKFGVDLDDLKSKLATKGDVKGAPTVRGVSIERGRYFVELLNNKIEKMESGPAHELAAIRDKFIEHMETTHPKLKEATKKYAEMSRDADIYERKGKLANAVKLDLYSKEPIMDATKVVSLLTDKTARGGEAIKRLVDGDKSGGVQDLIRQHFNHELFGSGGATKTPDAEQMRKLLETRRVALENSGLYKEFEDLYKERAAFQDPAKAAAAAEKSAHEIRTIQSDLKGARNPKEIAAASENALKMLNHYPPRISSAEYEKLRDELKVVKDNIEDHARAKAFATKLALVLGAGTLGVSEYVSHRFSAPSR